MTVEKGNITKFFWSSLLIQIIIFVSYAIWLNATFSTKIETHDEEIRCVKNDLNKKADLEMVLRIKSDADKRQDQILNDLQYIRERIDYLTDKQQRK